MGVTGQESLRKIHNSLNKYEKYDQDEGEYEYKIPKKSFTYLFMDFRFNTNLILFLASFLGKECLILCMNVEIGFMVYPLFYSVLLLDVIGRWKTLLNVVKAIYSNLRALAQTFVLLIITIFIYSTMAFYWFSSDYPNVPS